MLDTLDLEKEEITQLVPPGPHEDEKIKDEVIKITDPEEFLENFFGSDEYEEAYKRYYEGKNPIDVTEEEKRESFDRSDNARMALIDFSKNNRTILKYDPNMYSKEFNNDFQEYVHSIKDVRKNARYIDSDDIYKWDTNRRYCHLECASTLVRDGIVNCQNLAEGLVQLLTIEMGLETFGEAGTPPYKRIESLYRW
ncbi:MAG TPA: hypothetical protein PK564_00805 [bacterium]|nr:hypothetical protein [bacterium]